MKLMLKAPLLHFLLFCAAQTSGVEIESYPAVNADGFVRSELDKTVSLTCLTQGGSGTQAKEELVWLRNGAQVQLMDGNKHGSSSLCVTPVTREDNTATFTCQLKSDASVNASVTLDITYAPMLSGVEEVTVEEQAVLVLQCDIQSNPHVSVLWLKEENQLDLSVGSFVVTSNGFTTELRVNKVDRRLHQGKYECKTVSHVYGTRSKVFNVTVEDKTLKFPLMPMVAGLVVVACTALLAVASRWKRIAKCCK
ncbi:transmembrane and immunoglobulin domain-containing protein 1 [Myripristis murdjan]|uniref:transmembrane and immunoglobulin domain-containing protein 1 n=1 Tax=Myripristis murdjan TaxID=586833 RepID=UPI0011763512|nr:transmembrane and immunoglobulin domain-containing protein 1 [Myripristis murdjan]